ncbi:MAG: glucose-6-phosphate isomerase [Eubacteriales bacterium]|nr:glucose-6-phosphate isomerase [Eubacteriales bacterium]MDD3290444.1 glucose-6-phosphate isomerase [Eubacteriales bacterium]MDD3863477.1 glucose-6-phosphate isomerase [Eubacteriales bacterium]
MKCLIEMNGSMAGLDPAEIRSMQEAADLAVARLHSDKESFTGWVDLPETYDRDEIRRIRSAAQTIAQQCTALVVIGIGGSYLGARAVYELLTGSFAHLLPQKKPKLYFAGQNISAVYHKELMEVLESQEFCLCVISKSGTTAEPSIAFALLKDALILRYGKEEAARRIYAITDASKGVLRQEAEREGYETFVVPDDIGGRYSVLTPVGLLPLAAAGFDPEEFLSGARAAGQDRELMDQAREYAVGRNLLYKKGKHIEIFESYEPRFAFFAEWLKQLFGESEGKGGKGIFPASLNFSSDLHSMGQFLQEGTPCFFETILEECRPAADLCVPNSAGSPLAGKSVNDINRAALEGVAAAHRQAGIPMFRFELKEKISPQILGQVVYFFETACALSAYMMGVDPFDQPGVEAYKREMRERL